MSSERTYALKMRILSDHGHLSNEDAAVTLAHILGEHTKLVFYAHISQECNLAEIIELTRKKVMDDLGMDTSKIEFVVTSPLPTKVYSHAMSIASALSRHCAASTRPQTLSMTTTRLPAA